jgi:hypothetical protein
MAMLSDEIRDELGLDRFAASAYTPRPRPMKRLMGKIMRATLPLLMKCMGKRSSEP